MDTCADTSVIKAQYVGALRAALAHVAAHTRLCLGRVHLQCPPLSARAHVPMCVCV